MWENQGEHTGYAQQPNWNQWWDVGKSWDPNMEGYMWQAHPEWYNQQWNQWQHRAPPGLSSEEGFTCHVKVMKLGQSEEDFNATIATQKDTPDAVALSLLTHLKQDVPEEVDDEEDDKALAGHIESAVASFLAGGDLEDSDEEEVLREETTKAAERPEAQLSADAGVFVPMTINIPANHAREETSGPKCEYLISTLKRVGLKFDLDDVPTEKHINNFLEYIRKQPLPPKLCEDEELWELFHQEIRTTIASSYFNRICPRLAEVERAFAEHLPEGRAEELRADLILRMCANKTPGTYHILPPDGKGSHTIIFLAQTPSDFISFLDPAQSTGDEVPDADWNVFDEACKVPCPQIRRGTYGTGLALVAALVAAGALWRRASFAWQAWHLATSAFVLRGRCGTWRHLPSFCVAGVALGDICLRFVWQAWHSVTSAFTLCGRRGTYGTGLALVAALVAAGAQWRRASFAWQAWHLATFAFVLRDNCVALTALCWLWSALVAAPRLCCVAGVALGDICLRFVWQGWHLVTSAFTLCGRCGIYGTGLALVAALVAAGGRVAPRLFCVAGVALGDICLRFVWQAGHSVTSVFTLCGRRGTYGSAERLEDFCFDCIMLQALPSTEAAADTQPPVWMSPAWTVENAEPAVAGYRVGVEEGVLQLPNPFLRLQLGYHRLLLLGSRCSEAKRARAGLPPPWAQSVPGAAAGAEA
eukprot:s1651_g17.t1